MRRLRIFVCEFVTGGGCVGAALPPGLAREGDMMLGALVKDLADLPGLTLIATRDDRLPNPRLPAAIVSLGPTDDPWLVWRRQIADSDATWPIAPETGGLLERLSALVLDCGRILLASRPSAVRLAASKRETSKWLPTYGLSTPTTSALGAALENGLPPATRGWVVKPDDGAGAEDTFVLRSASEVRRWAALRPDIARFVIQPCMDGEASSLSLLCAGGRAALLACNSQDVRLHGDRLRYHGGIVGGREVARAILEPVAAQIAAALPDLWGHVGADLVETRNGPVVIEINPRLTTSYVGLHDALGINPAELVLHLLDRDIASIAAPERTRPTAVSIGDHAA